MCYQVCLTHGHPGYFFCYHDNVSLHSSLPLDCVENEQEDKREKMSDAEKLRLNMGGTVAADWPTLSSLQNDLKASARRI